VTNVPKCLRSHQRFNQFLFCFGRDHLAKFHRSYVRVETRTAIILHRLRTFLPAVELSGCRMTVHGFPFFLATVAVQN
jgi:hypothetical protein